MCLALSVCSFVQSTSDCEAAPLYYPRLTEEEIETQNRQRE